MGYHSEGGSTEPTQLSSSQSIDDLLVPRRKGLFRRRMKTEEILTWSSTALSSPLTYITDKRLHHLATNASKRLLKVMGEKSFLTTRKSCSIEEYIQDILRQALMHNELRDEFYLQLLKQLHKNSHRQSTLKGWELMSVYVIVFPSSKALQPYLEEQLELAESSTTSEIATMAKFCRRKLVQLCKNGSRGHLLSIPEIERARIAPFYPSPFGETLQTIMGDPKQVEETGRYPKILVFLSEAVLRLHGTSSEGIFRVPAHAERLIELKLRIEDGDYSLGDISDPAIPASLLKLWLRDLEQPLVPAELYDDCIRGCNDIEQALAILDRIPEPNRRVLKYIIKFMQVIGDPRYQPMTRMSIGNLAMVFAPNVLRCESSNPMAILESAKFEQCFVKTLVNYLDE